MNLVFPGNVNFDVVGRILVSLLVVAPNILCAELGAGLLGGWTDKSDQGLNIDNSSKVQKTIFLEMSKVMFSSRLKLDVPKIGATVLELLRGLMRVVKDQNLPGRVAKHDRDSSWVAFVWLNFVEHRAVAFGVEA